MFEVAGHSFSWRDLILIGGGIFLLLKATKEMHERLEGDGHQASSGVAQASISHDSGDSDSDRAQSINNGVTQQFANAGSSLIQKNLDVQPTITIRNGYKFNIMLNKDIVLPPWQPAY